MSGTFDPLTGEIDGGSDGTSIAAMAAAGVVVEPLVIIEGDGQLSLDVGGPVPTVSELALSLGSIPAGREWEQDQVIEIAVKVRVAEVHFKTKENQHGYRVTTRKHVAVLHSIVNVSD